MKVRIPGASIELNGYEVSGYSLLAIGAFAGAIALGTSGSEDEHQAAPPAVTAPAPEMSAPAAPFADVIAQLDTAGQYDLAYTTLHDADIIGDKTTPIVIPEAVTDQTIRAELVRAVSLDRASDVILESDNGGADDKTTDELGAIPDDDIRSRAAAAVRTSIYDNLARELLSDPGSLETDDDDEALRQIYTGNPEALAEIDRDLQALVGASREEQAAKDAGDSARADELDDRNSDVWQDLSRRATAEWHVIHLEDEDAEKAITDKSPKAAADAAAAQAAAEAYPRQCDNKPAAEEQQCRTDQAFASARFGNAEQFDFWADGVTDPTQLARLQAPAADQAVTAATFGNGENYDEWDEDVTDPEQQLRIEEAAAIQAVTAATYNNHASFVAWDQRISAPGPQVRIEEAAADLAVTDTKYDDLSGYDQWDAAVSNPPTQVRIEEAAAEAALAKVKYDSTARFREWSERVAYPPAVSRLQDAAVDRVEEHLRSGYITYIPAWAEAVTLPAARKRLDAVLATFVLTSYRDKDPTNDYTADSVARVVRDPATAAMLAAVRQR